ncbi:MAG: PDZ domain-containing protein [Planctomycetota bacterium]|nr:PDZ domain-containing protein [Planctomycetota bacterium]
MTGKSRFQDAVWMCILAAGAMTCINPATAKTAEPKPEKEKKAAVEPTLPADWIGALHWRCIGPANMGGRITDLAVYEADPNIWWAATASGGLVKTTNNGVTFEHQFDHEATVSIGDVAVAQSDPGIVWVGTGENNPRNSVSWGDGVYKSTDGGKTFTHMGLKESFQIGRIAIHPENPDIVYVGALGRLWGENEQRGLFKTTDGGETWQRILFVDEKTGVIDVQMHPADPDTLLVATWERQRDRYDSNDPAKKNGPGSGLYKTTDGGQSFMKITEGLPECNLGRIGLAYSRQDPDVVFAVVESEKTGDEPEDAPYIGIRGEDADVGARLTEITEGGPAAEAGLRAGDIVIALEDSTIHSYEDLLKAIRRHLAGDTVQIEVSRDRESVIVEVTFTKRPGEEEDAEDQPERRRYRSRRSPFSAGLGGQRENVQDQQGPEGKNFGGVYKSTDGGDTWTRINSVNPRPMYFSQIRVDPSDADHIYVLGIRLYHSEDGGETFSREGGRGAHPDHHAMWIDPADGRHIILGNDGGIYVTRDRMEHWDHLNHVAIGQFYHVGVSPRRDYMVYGGLQDNSCWGGPSVVRSGPGPINADWRYLGGGDGFICRVDPNDPDQVYFAGQNGQLGRYNHRTNERDYMRPRPPRGTRYRFNWKTPYILSNHNSSIYYTAGNYVFRSLYRGDDLKTISPEITGTDEGAATALAESRFDGDVLYVGTDDGALWRTRNGGHEWINLFTRDEQKKDEAATETESGEPEADETAAESSESAAPPARRPGRRERMMRMLMERDADGDGKIRRDEVSGRMERFFARLDANEDGVLEINELAPAPAPGPGRGAGSGAEAPSSPPAEEGEEPQAAAAADEPSAEEGEAPEMAEETQEEEEAAEPETETEPTAAPAGDPITGRWEAQVVGEEIPPGEGQFSFSLRLEPEGNVSGVLRSRLGEGEIVDGRFDRESKKLTFTFITEQMDLELSATLAGAHLAGDIAMAGGAFSMPFDAKRTSETIQPGALPEEEEPAEQAEYDWQTIDRLLPGPRRVSAIEPSRFEEGRLYVTFDGHRSNDDEPYIFVSENFGETWRSIRGNLTARAGTTRVIREDLENPDVLYLGTEFGAWVSIDRGLSWTSLNGSLPTVAVHELAQHPTSGEVVAATHGRSLWILDVTPLRQMTAETMRERVHLYEPNAVVIWRGELRRGDTNRAFTGENPPTEARIFYSLNGRFDRLSLRITDQRGEPIRELTADDTPGLHRATWDLRRPRPEGRSRYRRGPRVEPGTYLVELKADNLTLTQPLVIEDDPRER